jgi:hypothetical protein
MNCTPIPAHVKAWKLVRAAKRVTAPDVAMLADVESAWARAYLETLAAAGIVRMIGLEHESGESLYQLVRDTGPAPVTLEALITAKQAQESAERVLVRHDGPNSENGTLEGAEGRKDTIKPLRAWLRTQETFTTEDAVESLNQPWANVRRALLRLIRAGRIERVKVDEATQTQGKGRFVAQNWQYRVLSKEPVRRTKKPAKGTARDALWASIRVLREFTRRELEAHSGAEFHNVCRYLQALEHYGIVTSTTLGRVKHYRLVKDGGQERPATPGHMPSVIKRWEAEHAEKS